MTRVGFAAGGLHAIAATAIALKLANLASCPPLAGSIRNINLLRILLDAGYHVTFVPTAGGRQQHYVTQLRLMGVHVFPVMAPEQWMFQREGRCAYDIIMWVAGGG